MKLLIYGDVVGKLGRAGVKLTLPKWREEFLPDVVIANVENVMHGKGIGRVQIEELRVAGVQIFTGGNHSLEGKDFAEILNDETLPILRPANIPGAPGRGVLLYDVAKKEVFTGKSETAGDENSRWGRAVPQYNPDISRNGIKEFLEPAVSLLVINLIGQVFMRQEYTSPFDAVDKILENYKNITPYIILDWHAEATSEKVVMGHYLDGRVSLVYGTHTHVPSADAKILPKGTAYITDIGMTGGYHSVIGVNIEQAIDKFTGKRKKSAEIVETGLIEINAIFVELNEVAKPVDIKHLREIIPEDKIGV